MNETVRNDMPAAQSGRRKIRNDVIFSVVLVLTISLIGACIFFLREDGDHVSVSVGGELFGNYRLSEDTRVEIRTGERGEQLNILVIEDGKAYVESATCPDGICSAHRAISRDGESIACLPHRVIITVYSSDGTETPDVMV